MYGLSTQLKSQQVVVVGGCAASTRQHELFRLFACSNAKQGVWGMTHFIYSEGNRYDFGHIVESKDRPVRTILYLVWYCGNIM